MIIDNMENHFDKVTLLVTHYNRSQSLERLLEHFQKMKTSFSDIVVSDDGSKKEHLDYIKELENKFDFTLVTAPENKGLGNNINKGQDAVKTDYTLYVQEDFIPLESFDEHFKNGYQLMEEDDSIDITRFYAYEKYPVLKNVKDGFSEMVFKFWSLDSHRITKYSDHPHLRRKTFLEKFGRYSEMKNPEKTEYDMMISFLKRKGKAYIFKDIKSIFRQINSAVEPSTMERNYWRNNENILVSMARRVYRHLKFNYMFISKK